MLISFPAISQWIRNYEPNSKSRKSTLSGMHNMLQAAASGGSAPGGGGGGASNFDLASWMAGAQKSHQGPTSGTDIKVGAAKRRRDEVR